MTQQSTKLAAGQQLFSERCAACHGIQGEGASMLFDGKDIHFNQSAWQKRHTDKALSEIIRNGRGSMPAFQLSPEEEKAVLAYIRQLDDTATSK